MAIKYLDAKRIRGSSTASPVTRFLELDQMTSVTNFSASYDMYSDLGNSALSNTWVIRFKVEYTALNTTSVGDTLCIGITSTNSSVSPTGSNTGMGFKWANDEGGVCAYSNSSMFPAPAEFSPTYHPDSLTYNDDGNHYVEMIRSGSTGSATFTINCYPNSDFTGTPSTNNVNAGGVTGLRYFKVSDYDASTSNAGYVSAKITDIEVWDGVTTAGTSGQRDSVPTFEAGTWLEQVPATVGVGATYTDDKATFVTAAGTGWTHAGNNELASGELQWQIHTNDTSYYDLGAGNVSDTSWVLRFKWKIIDITRHTSTDFGWFGLSSESGGKGTTQDFVGFTYNPYNNYGYDLQLHNQDGAALGLGGGSGSCTSATDICNDVWEDDDEFWYEMVRNSTTLTLKVYSDSGYTTQVGTTLTKTIGSEANLRYILQCGDDSRTDNQTGHMEGALDDIKFYNGVTTATGTPAYETEFVDSSKLPENTLFEETDTYNQYWLQDLGVGKSWYPSWYDTQGNDRGWASDSGSNSVDTANNKLIIRHVDPLYISTGIEMLSSENFVIDFELNEITVPTGGRQDALIFSTTKNHQYPDDPSNTNWFIFAKHHDSGFTIKHGADNGSLNEVDSNIVALPTANTWYWYRFTRNGTTCTCSRYTTKANRDSNTSPATATTSSIPTTWTDSRIMKYFSFGGYSANPNYDVRNVIFYRGVTSV